MGVADHEATGTRVVALTVDRARRILEQMPANATIVMNISLGSGAHVASPLVSFVYDESVATVVAR